MGMRTMILIALGVLVLGGALTAGCLDQVLDPEMDFRVLEVGTNRTSPTPMSVNATNGNTFLWVKVSVENLNENVDLTVGPRMFSVDDNERTEERGEFMANMDRRRLDTIRVDPMEEKTIWVLFEVPLNATMSYIRFRGTLDEPVEHIMPEY